MARAAPAAYPIEWDRCPPRWEKPTMELLSDRLDRRRALRFVAGGLLAVPVGLHLAADADAATSWCRKDPDVLLEGTAVQIVVAVPDQYLSLVEGPTKVSFN